MDFAFSEEQEMLRSQAHSFLADRFPTERVAELAESDDGWDEKSWTEMAELGWTGLSVPVEQGGAGFGFLEEAVLFEEFGYALYPGPYFTSLALARPPLDGSEQLALLASGEARFGLAWAEGPRDRVTDLDYDTEAARKDGGWSLTGRKLRVPDAHLVDAFVVPARGRDAPGLWLVKASDVTIDSHSTMDRTRRLGTVTLDGVAGEELSGSGGAKRALERAALAAHAALGVEAVGVAQRALELATEHVKTREQFGKPIGTYQAVSHQVVDTYVDVELARSLAYWAAWCVAEADDRAPVAAAAAKSLAGEAAVAACERAIQVHGGIGFTYEHILHRLYKRAQWIDAFDGFGAQQRASIADVLLGG